MVPTLQTPTFLMHYDGSVNDYRSALGNGDANLVFERSTGDGSSFTLWILDLASPTVAPKAFVPSLNVSTRPDWGVNEIAFSNGKGIWRAVGGADVTPMLLPGTAGMLYPAWYPDGNSLLVMNQQESAVPKPCTSRIDPGGNILRQLMATTDVFAGMPSVNPMNPGQIVFAGQPTGQGAYDQNRNYIWLLDGTTQPATLRPLDQNAPAGGPFNAAFQGRAPWWSPNGKWVAFESNRASSSGLYAIFIQDSAGANPAMQVLDVEWNANHAKWFESGFELVVSVLQTPDDPSNRMRGIATLNVASFVT